MAELTFAEISKLLKYEPETGKLFWLPRTAAMFKDSAFRAGIPARVKAWNDRLAGKEAFSKLNNGYLQSSILGKRYLAHRVVWLMHYGVWPTGHIDHINGVRDENLITNLREASSEENARNHRPHKSNTSGVMGVVWHKRDKRWQASITISGKTVHLGQFVEKADAIFARKQAESDYGFHPNHGSSEERS